MALHTYGTMAVDWEERVRFDRLREERLGRISSLLAESELGALLCFDMGNIRYITATHIGTWAQDKLNRFCLLPRSDDPIMWDFGSAARSARSACWLHWQSAANRFPSWSSRWLTNRTASWSSTATRGFGHYNAWVKTRCESRFGI